MVPTAVPEPAKPAEYVIGMSNPMTGEYANCGKSHAQAALMPADEINAAGGVNGVSNQDRSCGRPV